MTEPSRAEPPDDGGGGPGEQSRERRDAYGSQPGNEAVEPRARSGRAGPSASWLQWVRAHPALAVAVLVFCLTAVVGLVLSIPPGIMFTGRSGRLADRGSANVPAAVPSDTASRNPGAPADEAPDGEGVARGPWIVESASTPSPRGLALVYAYRTLPPGGESRYEWFVRLQGPRSLLEEVDVVGWRMDPPAKNGGDFVSRDRAGDGFPLLGHGPGGWFGVSATARYKDGNEETLSRRIELPD